MKEEIDEDYLREKENELEFLNSLRKKKKRFFTNVNGFPFIQSNSTTTHL